MGRLEFTGVPRPSGRAARHRSAASGWRPSTCTTHTGSPPPPPSRGPTGGGAGGVRPAALRLGVGVIPYCPLGRGFLTGAISSPDALSPDDYRRGTPRFAQDNM